MKITPAGFIRVLGGLVTAALGGYGATLLAPPGADQVFPRVLFLMLAATSLTLSWVVSRHWDRRSPKAHWRRAFLVSVLLMLVGVAAVITYAVLRTQWSVQYTDQTLLVGSRCTEDLTEAGRRYFETEPDASDATAVWNNAGKIDEIWTQGGISRRRTWLWILCAASFFFVMTSMLLAYWFVSPDLGRVQEES